MNKIVHDLIEESKDYNDGEGVSAMYGVAPAVVPENLVELVVLECVRVCKENNAFVAAQRIKEHFGVT